MLKDVLCGGSLRTDRICVHEMLSVHLISGAASVPPLSLALLYKGKRLPNRVIRCAIYATSVVYELPIVNCQQNLYTTRIQKVYHLVLFSTACMAFCPIPRPALLPCRDAALPPPGYYSGRGCRCRKRSDAGAPGAEPPAKKLIVSPFPPGRALCERGRGDGGRGVYLSPSGKGAEKQTKGRVGRWQRRQAPRRGTTAAGAVSAVSGLMPGRRGRSPRQN